MRTVIFGVLRVDEKLCGKRMSVEFERTIAEFFEVIQETENADVNSLEFAELIWDGRRLVKILRVRFPLWFWSIFTLRDVEFHGAFLFHKFCLDNCISLDIDFDPFDIIFKRRIDAVVQSISHILSLPLESFRIPDHAGPLSDESQVCSCLLCRWKSAIAVLSHTSHPWSPNKLAMSVRRLIADGIPGAAREHVWLVLSGALHLMRTRRPDYASHFPKALAKCQHLELIDLDISRTFQGNSDWRAKKYDMSTRRILAAYSVRNPSVGYCQGLTYVVGLLVTVVNEELAFLILCAIVEDGLLPPDYYTSLQGAMVDRKVTERLISQFLPNLTALLDSQLEDYSFVSIPWNMCLFSTALSMEVSVRLWDFLFGFGPSVLFKTSLGILRELESALAMKEIKAGEIREKLSKIESSVTVSDIALFQAGFPELTNSLIAVLRDELRGSESCQPLAVQAHDSLNSCVSDDSYFGTSCVPPSRPSSRSRQTKRLAIEGLSVFMGLTHKT
jgi:hypothetical protein